VRRSYAAMAREIGLEVCSGVSRSGLYCRTFDHRHGASEQGRIHLVDTRVTKPGLARFLKLAALAQDPTINEAPPWVRTYLLHLASQRVARQLHVRMPPREVYDMDRAFVRASVAGMPNSVALRRRAFDWARR
jgi:hypothetical protein